jgi:hypothetical protein
MALAASFSGVAAASAQPIQPEVNSEAEGRRNTAKDRYAEPVQQAYFCACPECYGRQQVTPTAQTGSKHFTYCHDGNKLLMRAQGCSDEKRTFGIPWTACRNVRM